MRSSSRSRTWRALGESTGPVRGGSAAGAEPRASIWPAVEERIVDLVEQHRSTIVFSNSRRLAERLTSRLNEIATERAYGTPDPEPVPLDLDRPDGSSGVKPVGASFARGPAQHPGQGGVGTAARWGNGTPADGEGVVEIARAHHGSVSREQRAADRGGAEVRPAARRRRDRQPRARHRHGRGRPRRAGRVAAVAWRAACSASAAPATRSARSAAA